MTETRPMDANAGKNKRSRQKHRSREALLDAALALAGENRSVDSISLREITRAAGLTPNAFYGHFENLDALWLELAARACATLRQTLQQARGPRPDDSLPSAGRRAALAIIQSVESGPAMHQYFLHGRRHQNPAIRDAIDGEIAFFHADLVRDLKAVQRALNFAFHDCDELAHALAMSNFAIVENHLHNDRWNTADVLEELVQHSRLLTAGSIALAINPDLVPD